MHTPKRCSALYYHVLVKALHANRDGLNIRFHFACYYYNDQARVIMDIALQHWGLPDGRLGLLGCPHQCLHRPTMVPCRRVVAMLVPCQLRLLKLVRCSGAYNVYYQASDKLSVQHHG
jgi:hypothetical protein